MAFVIPAAASSFDFLQALQRAQTPHRLLTIAIRRGVLKDIQTLDDPFSGRQRFITIKPEFLNKPILSRTPKIGLIQDIQFYSLRRKTAEDLRLALGPDLARAIMAHDPKSVVLEKFNTTDRTALVNLTAIALGEEDRHSGFDQSLALTKLNDYQLRQMGPALNAIFDELRENDDEYPHEGTIAARKNRNRVLRRAAFQSLIQVNVDRAGSAGKLKGVTRTRGGLKSD
ncbi:hypothetical protein FZEAL_8423 [Fusarium zealandicum]|uniref:Uncharacterized protein n=1 Tax=Fusarium zealandicum TaxID=1053134 RepID=A0A8H4XHP3_9HYPO|nr:hypothetical protein FZEAL_8423 [Fusarium zealandicum]